VKVGDIGEEGEEIHFSEEDTCDYNGEVECPQVLADALKALAPPVDELLSERWGIKMSRKERWSR